MKWLDNIHKQNKTKNLGYILNPLENQFTVFRTIIIANEIARHANYNLKIVVDDLIKFDKNALLNTPLSSKDVAEVNTNIITTENNLLKNILPTNNDAINLADEIVNYYLDALHEIGIKTNIYYLSDIYTQSVSNETDIDELDQNIELSKDTVKHLVEENLIIDKFITNTKNGEDFFVENFNICGENLADVEKKFTINELIEIFPQNILLSFISDNDIDMQLALNINNIESINHVYDLYRNKKINQSYYPKFCDLIDILLIEDVNFYNYFELDKGSKLTEFELETIDEYTKHIKHWEKKYLPSINKFKVPFEMPNISNSFTDEQKLLLSDVLKYLNNNEKISIEDVRNMANDSNLDQELAINTLITPIIIGYQNRIPDISVLLNATRKQLLIDRYQLILNS